MFVVGVVIVARIVAPPRPVLPKSPSGAVSPPPCVEESVAIGSGRVPPLRVYPRNLFLEALHRALRPLLLCDDGIDRPPRRGERRSARSRLLRSKGVVRSLGGPQGLEELPEQC